MAEQKPCIQCGRAIDEYARACPYCNWWQSEPLPAARPAQVAGAPPQPATQYVPPVDNRARNKLIGIGALVALVVLAFSVGAFFHGSEPDLFRAGRHVYVVGSYNGASLAATSITTKCPSKYAPAKS